MENTYRRFGRETQRDHVVAWHGMTCMEWVLLYFNECSVQVRTCLLYINEHVWHCYHDSLIGGLS